jgi:hypothetical protein
MSRFDYADPGQDSAYCDPLTPDDDAYDLGDVSEFPAPPALAPMPGYGLAVLLYLMNADVYLFGMVDDHALQCADHSALIAVASREILPLAVDRISAVRMEIRAVLARRAHERRHENAQPLSAPPSSVDDVTGGSKVVAQPRPLAPAPSDAILAF